MTTDNQDSEIVPPEGSDTQEQNNVASSKYTQTFGEWMKEQREERSMTLEEIASVTKIQLPMLRNIEADNYSKLPAPAFIRGFIVSFSKFLGLDEKEAVERFREQLKKSDHTQSLSAYLNPSTSAQSTEASALNTPKKELTTTSRIGKGYNRPSAAMDMDANPVFTPKRLIIAGAIVLLIVITSILFSIGSKQAETTAESAKTEQQNDAEEMALSNSQTNTQLESATPDTAASVPAAPQQAEVLKPTTQSAPAVQQAASEASTTENTFAYHLKIRGAEGGSYVNVRVDQKNAQGTQLDKGQVKDFYGNDRLIVTMSNAGGVELFWNGKWYQPPGSRGDVKSLSLPADLEKLKEK